MKPTNAEIAALLRRYGSVLALHGVDRFRTKAYWRAAENPIGWLLSNAAVNAAG